MRRQIQHLAQWFSTRWSPRALGTRRYAAAATLCALGALSVALIIQPPAAKTTRIVVADTVITPGSTIAAGDVKKINSPPHITPPQAFSHPDDVVGSQVAATIPEGVAITSEMLMGREFLDLLPRDSVAVPVRLGDAAISELLQPGDRIDVWAARDAFSGLNGDDEENSEVVAQRALVLTSASNTDSDGVFGVTGGAENGGITLLAVSQQEAQNLAAAQEHGGLSIAFVN